MDLKEIIATLSNSVCIGHIDETVKIAEQMLGDFCEIKRIYGNSLVAFIKGECDYTIAVEAHTDEIGFIVTAVENGFLKVSCAGGFDIRTLPSHRVIVHGKEDVPAVFTSIPPHLSKGEEEFDDIKKLSLDTGLYDTAKDIIRPGDLVTYGQTFTSLQGNRVTGKALDDRAGVAALIHLAKMLKDNKPPVNVCILLCNAEELGTRGAKTAAFEIPFDEAVAVDVSFAAFPGIAPEECGTLGKGAMIGQSPVLSRAVAKALISSAENNNIPYQLETMGGRTSTDADVISITKSGVPTGLVSIPLRNMHTDAEVIDVCDVESTAKLLYSYIMSGGTHDA